VNSNPSDQKKKKGTERTPKVDSFNISTGFTKALLLCSSVQWPASTSEFFLRAFVSFPSTFLNYILLLLKLSIAAFDIERCNWG
jgi:hypothetical protein